MGKKGDAVVPDFAFHDFLRQFCVKNRGIVRSRYSELTKKFLDFNDASLNPGAFLRRPQFEALEMYVFVKEFMSNAQVYQIFDDWRNERGDFGEQSYDFTDSDGQMGVYLAVAEEHKSIFQYMWKSATAYPNYIYALTMGLGKTVLMATCIFYEFLLMNKYPKDELFCHNALVFAPDKTVLESLREIITFDKSLVVPREYCHILDSNIKFHFLDDADTTLNTIPESDFNIIISNTQKIIKKRVWREKTPMERLFDDVENRGEGENRGGDLADIAADFDSDEGIRDEGELKTNQRFEKLARLQSLGVYVDEAHHLFGKDLQKSMTALRVTINELARELTEKGTRIVACYNYTGTPYADNSVLPEVVYSYGLRDAIHREYLKDVDSAGDENVKSATFIKKTVRDFWACYGGRTYEGLPAKLAIFGATIEEVTSEIRPVVEEAIAELGLPLSKILVNVGDEKVTKSDDIRHFNDLDKAGTAGAEKQFILLCNKGREGWNCRSLFGVALFRSPKSKIFVLQATMRCLRQITDTQQTAMVRLSKENYDTLNSELEKNFRMSIEDLSNKRKKVKEHHKVRILKNKKIVLKRVCHRYTCKPKIDGEPPAIDFGLSDKAFLESYKSMEYRKESFIDWREPTETEIDTQEENRRYSVYAMTAEISNYLRCIPCSTIANILANSKDGADVIVEAVSKHNLILYDRIIPRIFEALFDVGYESKTEEKMVDLLQLPEGKEFYEFSAEPGLTVWHEQPGCYTKDAGGQRVLHDKSFHTDHYCFDSEPERKFFWQCIKSDKVREVYFTGMFTSQYNGLAIRYIDPDTRALRTYYPDFISFLDDGTIQIVEVKAENLIDQSVTSAKAKAAAEMAAESRMEYRMIPSMDVMGARVI